MKSRMVSVRCLALLILICAAPSTHSQQQATLTTQDVMNVRRVSAVAVSPSGDMVAYVLDRQRAADDEPGAAYGELCVMDRLSKESHPYIQGKVRVSAPQWKPDGSAVAFLLKRGERTQVWMIPVTGGEAVQITNADEPVLFFRWHPDGSRIAYVAQEPRSKREKALQARGYGFTTYEENLKDRNLYIAGISRDSFPSPIQLTRGLSVWSFEFSPDGRSIALAASEKPLVDQSYMGQRIQLLELQSGSMRLLVIPPGKLGNFCFSPQGRYLAFAGAQTKHDHAVSQAFYVPIDGGDPANITPQNHPGHITWVGWKDAETVLYLSADGVNSSYRTCRIGKQESKVVLSSETAGVVFGPPSLSLRASVIAFVGQSAVVPSDLYLLNGSGMPERLTTANPWLGGRLLGAQTLVKYKARDGRDIEGLLIHPVHEKPGEKHPLIVFVHGGPESQNSNGWLSSYSEPGQVLAGKEYLVFYPNYRASTGYGVSFAAEGFGDPAGKEFDDIADGIDNLTQNGTADRERVGLAGGSYGGYASAWFATYYTKYVRAVVMFVGISDLLSKQSTTDIPEEELFVHAGKPIEETWELSLKRSPVYWAHQSSTATLICGGVDDTRVHPSQSLELYRRMKINKHPAVRLVQYPGEEHGNARQPARIDLLNRTLEWFDWYVRDAKALNGPMPRLDISDTYGLKVE